MPSSWSRPWKTHLLLPVGDPAQSERSASNLQYLRERYALRDRSETPVELLVDDAWQSAAQLSRKQLRDRRRETALKKLS